MSVFLKIVKNSKTQLPYPVGSLISSNVGVLEDKRFDKNPIIVNDDDELLQAFYRAKKLVLSEDESLYDTPFIHEYSWGKIRAILLKGKCNDKSQ